MIRCLFIMHSVGGGAEKVTATLVDSLDRSRFSPTIGCVHNLSALPELFAKNGSIIMPRKADLFEFLRTLVTIRRLARESDVVVGTLELQSMLWAALVGGRKSIMWLHKDLGSYLTTKSCPYRVVYTSLLRWAVFRCAKLACVSHGVAESARLVCPGYKEKIIYLGNPVDTDRLAGESERPLPPEIAACFQHPVILSVGRLVPEKAYLDLLRAFALFHGRHPHHVLCIIGEGPQKEILRRTAEGLGIGEHVFLPGFLPPAQAMRRAEWFILSSVSEGCPLVILEAMACGLPVIATNCPSGPAFLLREGEDGILCPVGDPEALAQAMERMTEPETRALYAGKSLRRARDFPMDAAIRGWEALLGEVAYSARRG